MRVVTDTSGLSNRRRIALYGEPKFGKTRLATSLPWGDHWGERAVYVGWDEGAAELASVLPANRERLIQVYPEPVEKKNRDGSTTLVLDPHKEAIQIASRNWKKDYPEVGTIIWDTMTSTSQDLLSAYADTGAFSEDGHVSVGEKGTPTYMAQAMQGDYGLAQRATLHILKFLFNQPLNVIVLFHVGETEGNSGRMVIGPATVGRAGIEPVSQRFDNLFRVEARETMGKDKDPRKKQLQFYCITQRKGLYLGGLRSPHKENPMPEVLLEPDPINFWQRLDESLKGEVK